MRDRAGPCPLPNCNHLCTIEEVVEGYCEACGGELTVCAFDNEAGHAT